MYRVVQNHSALGFVQEVTLSCLSRLSRESLSMKEENLEILGADACV